MKFYLSHSDGHMGFEITAPLRRNKKMWKLSAHKHKKNYYKIPKISDIQKIAVITLKLNNIDLPFKK